MKLMTDLCFGRMWMRVLPPGAIDIFGCLILHGPSTREEIDEHLKGQLGFNEGLTAFPWDELHQYTDEELASNRHKSPETYEGVEVQTAAEVIAEELADREQQLAENSSYLTALGLSPQPTMAGALDLLVACKVLVLDEDGRHAMNPDAPLPGEVLPLSVEEAKLQDEARWERLYERLTYGIIALFNPEEQQVVELQVSLAGLAAQLDCDPESARQAIASLLGDPDFSSSLDVSTVGEDEPFELRVDWKAFNANRITIVHGSADDPE